MPSIGPLEVMAVAAIALIVFGPDKLPEIARTVGRTLSQLRRMADEVRDDFKEGLDFNVDDDGDAPGPAPRRDHPNVAAAGSASTAKPAWESGSEIDGSDEEEFDPNYDVAAADRPGAENDTEPAAGTSEGDDDQNPRDPADPVPPGGSSAPERDAAPEPPEAGRPPEQRAG